MHGRWESSPDGGRNEEKPNSLLGGKAAEEESLRQSSLRGSGESRRAPLFVQDAPREAVARRAPLFLATGAPEKSSNAPGEARRTAANSIQHAPLADSPAPPRASGAVHYAAAAAHYSASASMQPGHSAQAEQRNKDATPAVQATPPSTGREQHGTGRQATEAVQAAASVRPAWELWAMKRSREPEQHPQQPRGQADSSPQPPSHAEAEGQTPSKRMRVELRAVATRPGAPAPGSEDMLPSSLAAPTPASVATAGGGTPRSGRAPPGQGAVPGSPRLQDAHRPHVPPRSPRPSSSQPQQHTPTHPPLPPGSPPVAPYQYPSTPYAAPLGPAYQSPVPAAGQWVWRPDIPNPQGSYGAWMWCQHPPGLSPPGAVPAHPWWGSPPPPVPTSPPVPSWPDSIAGPYHPGTPVAPLAAGPDNPFHQPHAPQPYGAAGQYMAQPLPMLQGPYAAPQPGPPLPPQPRSPYAAQGTAGSLPLHQPEHRLRPAGAGGPYSGPPRDPAVAAAIAINKRITAALHAQEIFDIVQHEHEYFDTVCLATAVHRLASLRGAPNLHAQIVQAPEFYRLKQLILQRLSEFSARNIGNTLWALAKMNHHPGEEFLQALGEEMVSKADAGNAQNIANVLWSFATLGHHPGDTVMAGLCSAVRGKLPEFNSQNISNTVLAFAKLEWYPPEEVLNAIAEESHQKISSFSPQALSNTLWGLSKLEIKNDALMEAIGQEARHQLAEYNSQNLANTVWAYANLGIVPGGDLLGAFASQAILKIAEFSPQNVSNVLWAFAKLGLEQPELFEAAGQHAVRTMHTFQPQSIANMIWAHATVAHCPNLQLMQALVGQALRLLADFSPQNLSNTAWALATLKDCDSVLQHKGVLVTAITQQITGRLQAPAMAAEVSRQHLANFVWALATLESDPGRRPLTLIANALCDRADQCNPQEVANSVWAYAKLGHYHGGLMQTMAGEATRRIEEFSQQNLANLSWAYAKLGHQDDDLMAALAARAAASVADLSLQHLTNIIWAFASIKWTTPQLHTLVAEVKGRMANTQFIAQQLSNLLWSLSVMEECDRELWDGCMAQLQTLGTPMQELPDEALTQVFQAYMLLKVQRPEEEPAMPGNLLERAHEAWVQTTRRVKISEFHSEVSRLLASMGVDHCLEHLTHDQLFSVDIALPDEHIAIEVDGPHHFTANTFRPLGEMYARRTLLEARGWTVVSVPFYLWSGDSQENRQATLQRLLAEARTSASSGAQLRSHPTHVAVDAVKQAAAPGVEQAGTVGQLQQAEVQQQPQQQHMQVHQQSSKDGCEQPQQQQVPVPVPVPIPLPLPAKDRAAAAADGARPLDNVVQQAQQHPAEQQTSASPASGPAGAAASAEAAQDSSLNVPSSPRQPSPLLPPGFGVVQRGQGPASGRASGGSTQLPP